MLFPTIEEMQIFFGEDTDNDGVANRLVPPGAPGLLMTRVVTLNVNVLAASEDDQVAIGEAVLTNAIWNSDPGNDGRIRREFAVTVALRNPQ